MSDSTVLPDAGGQPDVSTQLDDGAASPNLPGHKDDNPYHSAIEAAFGGEVPDDDDDTIPEPEPEAEPEPEVKAKDEDEDEADDKAEEADQDAEKDAKSDEDKAGEREPKAEKQSEGRKAVEAPARFLPKAKELWTNTPNAVKQEVVRMQQEFEAETTHYREVAERYEPIREFDNLARANGRAGVHESLAEIVRLEQMMQTNPLLGINQILMQAGPRKADGSPVTLMELAQHVVSMGPQGYQQTIQTAQREAEMRAKVEEPQREVETLKQQLAEVQKQQLLSSVIEPFKAAHPRFNELQEDIAFFLNSGKVPLSLSHAERLEVAYDMAERLHPVSYQGDQDEEDEAPAAKASRAASLSGKKSVRGSPTSKTDTSARRSGSVSHAEALRRSFSELGL